jgi:hypothetical protein
MLLLSHASSVLLFFWYVPSIAFANYATQLSVKVWWKMFFTITVPAAQLLFEN